MKTPELDQKYRAVLDLLDRTNKMSTEARALAVADYGGLTQFSGDIKLLHRAGYLEAENEVEDFKKYRKKKRLSGWANVFKIITTKTPTKDAAGLWNAMRKAQPAGPEMMPAPEKFAAVVVAKIKSWLDCYKTADDMLADLFKNSLRSLPPRPARKNRRLRFAEIKDSVENIMVDSQGNAWRLPDEVIARALGSLSGSFIDKDHLQALTHVMVSVPLDCPDDEREKTITRIVQTWKRRRIDGGYKGPTHRDRKSKIHEKIEELVRDCEKSIVMKKHYSPGDLRRERKFLAEYLAENLALDGFVSHERLPALEGAMSELLETYSDRLCVFDALNARDENPDARGTRGGG